MTSSVPGENGDHCACGAHPTGATALDPTLQALLQFNLDLDELLRFYR